MWLLEWIKYNWISIVTFVSSANFIAIICLIVRIVVNIKTGKLQNKSLTTLIADLNKLNSTKESVDKNTSANINLVERVQNLENELIVNNRRIGAMLDVMGIVYMRSKDEDVRTAVANVISTVQYRDTKEVETLKLTVSDLKEQLSTALKEIEFLRGKYEQSDVSENNVSQDAEPEEIVLRG